MIYITGVEKGNEEKLSLTSTDHYLNSIAYFLSNLIS